MPDLAIRIENLGKLYRLGEVGTGTLSHDLNRWWHRVRGKEDPYQKIGQSNDRTRKAESDYVWALRDINLEVKKGEVLGIIGRNGAGKSTLLKILSQVTSPTTGRVEVFGRIASLLEVGTGFHPELTGRENIFLNGAILGMRRHEIQKKFDEIVDFAGVEAYIDTPVKRYSSGMYVRLAFAVAAFLEPDILVVDEVLAVGDAEFQKKCLGRMKDVSVNEGRTVLFVSHNMAAIRAICRSSIILEDGKSSLPREVKLCIEDYVSKLSNGSDQLISRPISKIASVFVTDCEAVFDSTEGVVKIQVTLKASGRGVLTNLGLGLNTLEGQRITSVESRWDRGDIELEPGDNKIFCEFAIDLNPGCYSIVILVTSKNGERDYVDHGNVTFNVYDYSILPSARILSQDQGSVQVKSKWKI